MFEVEKHMRESKKGEEKILNFSNISSFSAYTSSRTVEAIAVIQALVVS